AHGADGLVGGAAGAHAPVVMLVLDELPLDSLHDHRGQVDAGRFPNFARLAERSTWFRHTAAVDNYTAFAVPALLTGNRPRAGRAGDELGAEFLAASGGRDRLFRDFVGRLGRRSADPPPLAFLHVLLPHNPWIYQPDGRRSAADHAGLEDATHWGRDQALVDR